MTSSLAPAAPPPSPEPPADNATREKLRRLLREGKLDDKMVEIDTADAPPSFVDVFSGTGMEEMVLNLRDMFPQGARRTKRRRLSRARGAGGPDRRGGEQARSTSNGCRRTPSAAPSRPASSSSTRSTRSPGARAGGHGPDVSREGVQRDLLPIVEGSTVTTKYGPVKTDHVLFIAAGAFHVSKPKDLIPELQGRFPIRVELESLTDDGLRPHPDRARERADEAVHGAAGHREGHARHPARRGRRDRAHRHLVNARMENIGARRLHTIMERVLDDLAFEAPELGQTTIPITAAYVRERLDGILKDEDLSQYIL